MRMLFCMWSSWKWSHMNLRIFQISWILLSMAKNRFIHCSSNHFNMHWSLCQWKSVQMRCLLVIFIYSIIVCVEQQSQPASCKITNKRTTWNEVNWTELNEKMPHALKSIQKKEVFLFVSGKFNCLFIKETRWKGTLIPNDNKHALQSKETAMLKDQPLNFVNCLPETGIDFLASFFVAWF